MRVYISGDIEGCTGLVSWSQCDGPDGGKADWSFARRMYTHDINAAIRGARAGGATEIVVKDSHGFARNLLVDELEPGVELISGYGGAIHGMMEGVQDSFDACFLVGYHSMAGTRHGVMEHALAGALHRMWIGGKESGEIGASMYLAGAFGVPLVFVSSDSAGCAEYHDINPAGVSVSVKDGLGRYMAKLKHPSVTSSLIEKGAREGLSLVGQVAPVRIEGTVEFKIQFRDTALADLTEYMEGITRLDGYTVRWEGNYVAAHTKMYHVFAVAYYGQRGGAGG